jgi:glycerate kinase
MDAGGLNPRLREVTIDVACDVGNPLLGEHGASAVFGPQKGATPEMVEQLDANLTHFAAVISRDLGAEVARVAGAGAAGGMGAALLTLGGRLRPGIEIILDAVDFEAIAQDADLIITGEGRIDSQTVSGKAPIGVARIAKRLGKPVIGIAGSLADDVGVVYAHGIDAVFSIVPRPCTLEDALDNAAANIRLASRNIAETIRLAREMQ